MLICIPDQMCRVTQMKCFFFCADVIVHRLLAASIGISKLPSVFQDRLQLTSIADSKKSRHDLIKLDHLRFYPALVEVFSWTKLYLSRLINQIVKFSLPVLFFWCDI